MKYIDTNILIRLATRDNPALADRAETILGGLSAGEGFVSGEVVAEFCFVLEFNSYKLPRELVCRLLNELLSLRGLSCDSEIAKALKLYGAHRKLDFTDCLLAVRGGMKAENVITFDKDLQKVLS